MGIVNLHKFCNEIDMTRDEREQALSIASWVTDSPERECSAYDQEIMARYCLWARQKLDAVLDVINEDLTHD